MVCKFSNTKCRKRRAYDEKTPFMAAENPRSVGHPDAGGFVRPSVGGERPPSLAAQHGQGGRKAAGRPAF